MTHNLIVIFKFYDHLVMTVARVPKNTRVHFPGNQDSDDTHLVFPPQLQSIDQGINHLKKNIPVNIPERDFVMIVFKSVKYYYI